MIEAIHLNKENERQSEYFAKLKHLLKIWVDFCVYEPGISFDELFLILKYHLSTPLY